MLILQDVGLCLLFGLLGIVIMVIGFKVFDWIIPLDFNKELENKNIAVAIVIAGFLIGIAIIVGQVVAG
jgi:uncharacterized membrane protein YjfL (UPF0719 family)